MPKEPSNSVHPKSRAEWRKWLEKNHARAEGVWLISYKKASGKPYVDADELIEAALCFGWVDSKPNKLDDERAMKWFAPRKAGTGWSKLQQAARRNFNQSRTHDSCRLSKNRSCKERWFVECARCSRDSGNST